MDIIIGYREILERFLSTSLKTLCLVTEELQDGFSILASFNLDKDLFHYNADSVLSSSYNCN